MILIYFYTDPSGAILSDSPQSLISQAITAVGSLGGFSAIATGLYSVLFVRRFRLTSGQLQQQEMTLRGYGSKSAPDVDDAYVALAPERP